MNVAVVSKHSAEMLQAMLLHVSKSSSKCQTPSITLSGVDITRMTQALSTELDKWLPDGPDFLPRKSHFQIPSPQSDVFVTIGDMSVPSSAIADAELYCKGCKEVVTGKSDSFFKHLGAQSKLQCTLTATSSSNQFKAVRAMTAASSKAAWLVSQTSSGLAKKAGHRDFASYVPRMMQSDSELKCKIITNVYSAMSAGRPINKVIQKVYSGSNTPVKLGI
jgi:hypothetical protein